jgi:hypothetical protein
VFARAHTGDVDGATLALTELREAGIDTLPRDWLWPASLAMLGETAALVGDRAAARTVRDLLSGWEGQLIEAAGGGFCMGAADRYLALLDAVLGERDDLAARFGRAAALEEHMDSPALAARTRAVAQQFG